MLHNGKNKQKKNLLYSNRVKAKFTPQFTHSWHIWWENLPDLYTNMPKDFNDQMTAERVLGSHSTNCNEKCSCVYLAITNCPTEHPDLKDVVMVMSSSAPCYESF